MAVTPPVSLEDFKTFLRWTTDDDSRDAELSDVLGDATDLIESACGPMVTREITHTIRKVSCGSFMLKTWPVVEVTQVVDHFTAVEVDVDTLDVNLDTGVVCGVGWSRGYDVTYTVGRADEENLGDIPGPLREATKVVGEQLWQSRRGPSGTNRYTQSGVGNADQTPTYRGFAWPNRALQLIEPYRQLWVG